MPRFALLAHDFPTPHFDLMLESDGALRTWRVQSVPARGAKARAEAIGDHRLAYLDYEGPVSGNRGIVKRIDGGELEWHIATPDHIVAHLHGALLNDRIELLLVGNEWICSLGE